MAYHMGGTLRLKAKERVSIYALKCYLCLKKSLQRYRNAKCAMDVILHLIGFFSPLEM